MVRPEHQDTNINSKYHKVMAWLSPSFPVGAFAYSHGLNLISVEIFQDLMICTIGYQIFYNTDLFGMI